MACVGSGTLQQAFVTILHRKGLHVDSFFTGVDDPGDEDEEPIPPLPDALLPLSDKLANREKRQTRVDVEVCRVLRDPLDHPAD